jgi:hypothetical protein
VSILLRHRWTAIWVSAAAASVVVGIAIGEWPLGLGFAAAFGIIAAVVEPGIRGKDYLLVLGAGSIAFGIGDFARYSAWEGVLRIAIAGACFGAWEVARRRERRIIPGELA